MRHAAILATLLVAAATPALAQTTPDPFNDRPRTFQKPEALYDYTRMDVMIPMRDKVRLHTVVLIPKGLTAPARRTMQMSTSAKSSLRTWQRSPQQATKPLSRPATSASTRTCAASISRRASTR
jgi:predicted acyl esterase